MSNQLQITGGAKVRDLNGVITGTTGVLSSLPINTANGIPQLDSSGKILVSQLPNSVMEFLGTWNAATNTPTLANGTGNAGDVYLCNVAGTVNFGAGPITFSVGDYVVYSGSTWERSGGAVGTVTSVAASITGNSVGLTGSPITTAGTLAFAFAGTNLQYINGAGNLTTFPSLTGFVPYTGATANVNLGAYSLTANALIKNGGVDTQFLKADGSIDNNTYLTANDLPSTLSLYATNVAASVSGYFKLVTTIDDPDFNTTAVNVSTGAIVTTTQLIASLVSPPNLINGNPGVFNVTTIGNIRKVSGSGQAEFYFEIYKRTSAGVETLVGTSAATLPVVNSGYAEFSATAIWNDGTFDVTDTIVLKFYGARIAGGSNPTYDFQFGGVSPVRTIVPIPTAVIPNIYLGQLADVEDGTASNNDGIYYDSTAVLWKYKTIAEVLGYTPANDSLVVHLAGTETITGAKTFTGLTDFQESAFFGKGVYLTKNSVPTTFYSGSLTLYSGISASKNIIFSDNTTNTQFIFDNSNKVYTFPAASGTVALLESTQTFTGEKTFSNPIIGDFGILLKNLFTPTPSTGYIGMGSNGAGITISIRNVSTVYNNQLIFPTTASNNYNFPNASGTIALTSNLTSFITLTSLSATSPLAYNNTTGAFSIQVANTSQSGYLTTTDWNRFDIAYTNRILSVMGPLILSANTLSIYQASTSASGYLSSTDWNTFNNKASTASLANYLPLSGGTLTGALVGTQLSINTTNATGRINIQGPNDSGLLYLFNSSANARFMFNNYFGFGIDAMIIQEFNSSNVLVRNIMSFASGGNIGIGISNPGRQFQIGGTGSPIMSLLSNATGTGQGLLLFGDNNGDAIGRIVYDFPTNALWFYTNSTKQLTIASTGAATFSGTLKQSSAVTTTGATAEFYNASSSGYGMYIQAGTSTNYSLLVTNYLGATAFQVLGNGAATFSSSVRGTGFYTSSSFRNYLEPSGIRLAAPNDMSVLDVSIDNSKIYIGSNYYSGGSYLPISLYAGNFTQLYLNTTGNVLVGTTTDNGAKLQVAGGAFSINNYYLQFASGGVQGYIGQGNQITGALGQSDLFLNAIATDSRIFIQSRTGGVYLATNATSWTAWSDERLKNINGNIENAVDKLMTLRTIDYSWKSDTTQKHNLGLIAQDVQKVFPQVIDLSKMPNSNDDIEYLGVRYQDLVPVLVKAIQEQQVQINELKQLINK